ncbi:MAG: GNAT family N-acetyltransferase [Hyphomicrobiaceae bacterium]
MPSIRITKEERDARHGRYVAKVDGVDAEGEMTFTHRGPGVISLDHTGVPDALGGRGIAKALLDHLLEDARSNGFRIIPICPFVRGQYAKHPEWSDLFVTKPGEKPVL